MRQQRVISSIYAMADSAIGNIYVLRKARSRAQQPGSVTVLKPVAVQMGGVTINGLRSVKVIKSPRTKALDKEQRKWYACLSK